MHPITVVIYLFIVQEKRKEKKKRNQINENR